MYIIMPISLYLCMCVCLLVCTFSTSLVFTTFKAVSQLLFVIIMLCNRQHEEHRVLALMLVGIRKFKKVYFYHAQYIEAQPIYVQKLFI